MVIYVPGTEETDQKKQNMALQQLAIGLSTAPAEAVSAAAGTETPEMDGVAAVGTSDKWAHEDHVHPTDTALVKLAGNQTITGGYTLAPFDAGTKSSGTFTPNATNGNYQYYTNGGAHTVAAPSSDCAIDLLITNNSSAGSITFSGFTVNSNIGEPLTTTNGHKFILSIRRINGTATYTIKALQ
jgi:hypothetical protein